MFSLYKKQYQSSELSIKLDQLFKPQVLNCNINIRNVQHEINFLFCFSKKNISLNYSLFSKVMHFDGLWQIVKAFSIHGFYVFYFYIQKTIWVIIRHLETFLLKNGQKDLVLKHLQEISVQKSRREGSANHKSVVGLGGCGRLEFQNQKNNFKNKE